MASLSPPQWHGVAIIQSAPIASPELQLYTDASDKGFGCLYRNSWIASPWRGGWADTHINSRELFAVWVAVRTWGRQWANQQILIHTDSESITFIWRTGTCKDKVMMRLIRALFFFAAAHNINILMHHIPGTTNVNADFLSRLQVNKFRQSHPMADEQPTIIPAQVWDVSADT
jgi:hypothetical protein